MANCKECDDEKGWWVKGPGPTQFFRVPCPQCDSENHKEILDGLSKAKNKAGKEIYAAAKESL